MTTLPQHSPMRLPRPNPSHLAIPSANGHVPAVAHPSSPGLSGADAWRVIRANLWLIIGLAIVAGICGFFLNYWLALKYPRYTSTATIRIQVPSELPSLGSDSRMLVSDPSPQSIELEQQTQAASLTNRYFLGSLLQTPDNPIRQTGWFQEFGNHVDQAKDDLQKRLSVTPLPNTRLIEISAYASSPRDALVIAREVVNRHIHDRAEKMQEVLLSKSQNLDALRGRYLEQLSDLDARINTLNTALAQNYGSNDQGTSALGLQMQILVSEESRALRDYGEAKTNYETFLDEVKNNLTPTQLTEIMGRSDTGSQAEISRLQVAIEASRNRYGANSQQIKELESTLKAMQQSSEDLDAANRDKAIAVVKKNLEAKVKFAEVFHNTIAQTLQSVRDRMQSMATTMGQKQTLMEQKKETQDMLSKVQHDYDSLQLTIQQHNWSTADINMPADMPESPSFPKLPLTMSVAIAFGLILALSIAFLRELMDTTVRSPRDIAKVGQLNLLGMIPHEADDPESAGARLPLAIFEAPHSVIAEQFRQVRTRLQHSASLDTVRSLLVTGTAPGDGKTVVACNLAAGLALNGRRILLVDANFRRPQVHSVFNIPNEVGFGDVLNSLDLFDQTVRESEVPNLSVLPSGAKPSNSTELLESQLLVDFIERALEEYDHVIFDSGPLLIVSETAALAPRVDGVVSVVRARGNSRGMLQRLRDQLRQLKAEHLGVILNAVRSQSGGYYAPMIKSYYAYQNR